MPDSQKLSGTAFSTNSIPANRIIPGTIDSITFFDTDVSLYLNYGGRPTISNISYFGANTTANVNGNQTITLTGTNFNVGITVYIEVSSNAAALSANVSAAPSVSRTNATSLTFTTPARAAGTYLIYVINTDGGYAIRAPGIVYA